MEGDLARLEAMRLANVGPHGGALTLQRGVARARWWVGGSVGRSIGGSACQRAFNKSGNPNFSQQNVSQLQGFQGMDLRKVLVPGAPRGDPWTPIGLQILLGELGRAGAARPEKAWAPGPFNFV